MLRTGGRIIRLHGRRPAASSLEFVRHSSLANKVMAIRREDNSPWERRAPLAPKHVKSLVAQGVKVIVQPSNRRCYPMEAYSAVGAQIQEDISEASLILGVKQVPVDLLEPHKTYAFFSHTIKAQEANMGLLDAILEKSIRLIDYERMEVDKKRVVAFGKYAGVAGMIDILHGLGLRLLALGHHTPFMHIGPAHNYRHSEMAKQAIRDAGYEIALGYLPKSLGPLTFVFTGAGNVSQGAQEIFQQLPHEFVEPEHLAKVATHGATDKLYATVVDMEHHLVRKDSSGFDMEEFFAHPERYGSTFSLKIAPYSSVIVNGIYWAPNMPRLISIPDAKNLMRREETPWLPVSAGCPQLPHRLLAICDISADPGGSIEFMKECTTIDKPFCLYDADEHMNTESFNGDGVLICSIDNMPTQIPMEATEYFGNLLLPYVPDFLMSDAWKSFEEYDCSPVVKDAVIASNGKLTPKFEYIDKLRAEMKSSLKARAAAAAAGKRVLVLGAGYVSAPVVDYLTRDKHVHITVAAALKTEADALGARYPNTTPVLLDVQRSQEELEHLIQDHDVVVSLLPYSIHPMVAKLCIKYKRNMVTASYKTPEMEQLDKAAKEAGITVMNEVGVDPGIDHLLAIQCFEDVQEKGGKVVSYVSWCGGVPAPENSDNPLRYKFSWSPTGVLRNVLSPATYLQNNKTVEIEEGGELLRAVQPLEFMPGLNLEGFPNRDSTKYKQLYNIENAKTIIRGTIRYKGFSHAMEGLIKLGLIDPTPHTSLHPGGPDITWKGFLCGMFGKKHDILVDSLATLTHERLQYNDVQLQCIQELGLFNNNELVEKRGSPLETFSHYLAKHLAYNKGERDMIIMHHEIGVQYQDGTEELRKVDFTVYGQPSGYSAMAASVGFPTAIATKMVLDGEIQAKGMQLPFTRDIYRPMLQRLKQEGLEAIETAKEAHRESFNM